VSNPWVKSIRQVAEYHLRRAKRHLEHMATQQEEDQAWLDFETVEAEEEVAKWERVLERM
jgi:hypothetical protein